MFLTACILPSVHIIQRLLPRESRRRGNETQDNAENCGTTARQPSTWAVEVAKSWWTWSIAMAVVTLTLTTLLLFMVLNPSYFYPMQFFEGDSRTWAVQDQVLKPWAPKAVCCLIQAWLRRQRWLVHVQHPSNGGFGGHHVGNTWRFQSWLMLMAVYTTF
jgi:hypothetical protein